MIIKAFLFFFLLFIREYLQLCPYIQYIKIWLCILILWSSNQFNLFQIFHSWIYILLQKYRKKIVNISYLTWLINSQSFFSKSFIRYSKIPLKFSSLPLLCIIIKSFFRRLKSTTVNQIAANNSPSPSFPS